MHEDGVLTSTGSTFDDAVAIMRNYRTCEFTTVFRDGVPQTWPVSALLLRDGRFLICTSIGFPQKVFNIRRNPKVSLLFSEPTGSGSDRTGAVLICGGAVTEDRVIADMTSSSDLAALCQTVIERQPASKFMSSFLGRRLFPSYYWRIAIYVTPIHGFYWQTRNFTKEPQSLDLKELRRVAAGK
ncbi:pyridoxamine 5'-phosphate oxidase [Mycobacterium triplex]|uniref:Pyridoxamine 5'-phosphate oxidase n=1 Tax=Mycobacterium triplex TaxID=47839 RepID=A0A024K0C0_9MYCO|nr:pyridoxamine 5'-phosphate oxidase family protein [Mycobacterium triplex]ORX04870.1 pyridoxamine 5'-phosphate oxidase [Mycobacterium triplex]CDO89510.1 pyridoxamine 5'-phosphate oxidase-like protein [Mycobacterium triplex]